MDKILPDSSAIKTKLINGKPVSNSFQLKKNISQSHPDYKLDLSDKAKSLNGDLQKGKTVDFKTEAQPSKSSFDLDAEAPAIPVPIIPSVPSLDLKSVSEAKDIIETTENIKKVLSNDEPSSIDEPAVFFVGGLRILDFDFLEDGMKSMTEAVDTARYYEWDQKGEMLDEIKLRSVKEPIILVGHGLGADTAVEIAQDLNTLDNKFRRVDLLVTLNSIGLDNDFIPENVLVNKNYLTADNGWIDDSANIALNYKTTKVENFLHPNKHSELDEAKDIQRDIIAEIDRLIL